MLKFMLAISPCLLLPSLLTSNANVANHVEWHKFGHHVHLFLLCWCSLTVVDLGTHLPKLVQPCELEELLRKEEGANKVGLWGPEGDISVVDILHIRSAIETILLGCEVVDEGGRCDPPSGAV